MSGGSGDPPPPPLTGGELLLQLLKNPRHQPPQILIAPTPLSQQQQLPNDPAVASVGPSLPFPPSFQFNGHDLPFRSPSRYHHHSHSSPPPFAPHDYFTPQYPNFSSTPPGDNYNQALFNPSNNQLNFGSFDRNVLNEAAELNLAPTAKVEGFSINRSQMGAKFNGLDVESNRIPQVCSMAYGNNVQERAGSSRSVEGVSQVRRLPPPGFSSARNKGIEKNVDKGKGYSGQTSNRNNSGVGSNDGNERERLRFDEVRRVSSLLDDPSVPRGSKVLSVSAGDIEQSLMELHGADSEDGKKCRNDLDDERELDDLDEQFVDSLVLDDGVDEKDDKRQPHKSRDKI